MTPQIIRHGEVILKPVSALPQGAILDKKEKKHIVAHSETGHHHVLEAKQEVEVYTASGEKYLVIPSLAKLFHQKTGGDVHKTHEVAPSVYQVVIKKSYNYFSKAMEKVRD